MNARVLTIAEDGVVVEGRVGETILLEVRESPSTGYVWDLAVNDRLAIGRDAWQPSSTDLRLIGGGGMRRFEVTCVAAGRGRAVLLHQRPWMVEVDRTFVVTVDVIEPPVA